MRKILVTLLIVIVTMSILWIVAGRQVSEFADRFQSTGARPLPIHSISYEGSGDGGTLVVDGARFDLAPLKPHVGSTPQNELALASGGKVFAFGPFRPSDTLASDVPPEDSASLTPSDGFLPWPNFGFRTNHLPLWQRHRYWQLVYKKHDGARLRMIWRFQNYFDSHEEITNYEAAGLIRVEISGASR
jgi:hypothetical protein